MMCSLQKTPTGGKKPFIFGSLLVSGLGNFAVVAPPTKKNGNFNATVLLLAMIGLKFGGTPMSYARTLYIASDAGPGEKL